MFSNDTTKVTLFHITSFLEKRIRRVQSSCKQTVVILEIAIKIIQWKSVKDVIGLLLVSNILTKQYNDGCLFSSLLVRDLSLRGLSNSDGTKRVRLPICPGQFIEAHGQYFLHHAYQHMNSTYYKLK